jgi:molybdenum cofactor synthesis domain-containing protein
MGDEREAPLTPAAHASPPSAPQVEIVSAGNEVLLGDVVDTNSNWLCKHITGLGGQVRRTVMVRDEVEAIADELRAALQRRPQLIFTVGGLGPTQDDLTLQGVAAATGRPLELHPEAERMVRDKYAEFAAQGLVPFADMNEARRKMARLPAGATPLRNPIGGAPGVLLEVDATTIVSLPGVPEELYAIVSESLRDRLTAILGAGTYDERVLLVDTQDESALSDVLRAIQAEHPHVYVKSRAKRFATGDHKLRLTLSARGTTPAEVTALLQAPLDQLRNELTARGFRVTEEADAADT